MRTLTVLAAIGLVTASAYAQEDTKVTADDGALEALVRVIHNMGAVDSLWRLDPDVVVGLSAGGVDRYARDSAIVANVLGRPIGTFNAVDHAGGCPIHRSGEKLGGCDREGGIQLLSIHRSGSHRTLVNFMVYLSNFDRGAPENDRSWRVVLEKQADGSYKLKRPPMLILAH